MTDFTYAVRSQPFSGEYTYRLSDDALTWSDGDRPNGVALARIRAVNIFRLPGFATRSTPAVPSVRCILTTTHHAKIRLSSHHHASFSRSEDRSARLRPFLDELVRRVAAANPGAAIVRGQTAARLAFGAIGLLGTVGLLAFVLGFTIVMLQDPEVDPAIFLPVIPFVAFFLPLAVLGASLLRRGWPRRVAPGSAALQEVWGPTAPHASGADAPRTT